MPTRKPKGSPQGANTARRLSDRFGELGNKGERGRQFPADDVDPLGLAAAVAAVIGSGDAIMFGRTRDGGCMVITILSGDDRRKFYPDDVDSCRHACAAIAAAYDHPVGYTGSKVDPQKIG